MSRSDEQRVGDILDAAKELAEVTSVGRESFLRSVLHVRAAERLLEIIGKASNALSTSVGTSTQRSRGATSPP